MNTKSYKYSLKRRISAAYISVYVGICVLIILSFIIGCVYYISERYDYPAENICDTVGNKISESGTVEADSFRQFLYETCLINGAKEIFVYNPNNELLVATSYTIENDEFFDAKENKLLKNVVAPFIYIRDGLLLSEETALIVSEKYEYEVNILIHFSITDELSIFTYMINMSFVLLMLGMVLFVIFGVSKTHTMLTPINEMTEVAKKISAENMNLRIGHTNAKFELSELAETINSMMDRLQTSYDKQKQFVSDVSHELRTPISVISGYANLLNRWGKDSPEILEEGITNIIDEAENMNELVQTLLFLARHDNETLKFEPEEADVSAIMTDIVKDAILVNPDVVITSEIQGGLKAFLDDSRFRQAVRVFVDNAVKYSDKDEKKIHISLIGYDDRIEVSVKDNGVGISEEDLGKIFDRFYRADESRTKSTGGYGLGLSIAKAIVLMHGGKIKVRSKPGVGSEFIIMIPHKKEISQ